MQSDDKKDKNKTSFWSNLPEAIKAIATIITAIGGLAGLILALNEIGALDQFKPTPTPTQTPISTYGWSVYFEQEIDEYFWKPGINSYQIIADCPDTEFFGDIDKRIEFSVNENAQLFPNNVIEFRFNGIPSPNKGEPKLSSINPKQNTKIVLGYVNLSLEQATQATKECQVQAIINDKGMFQLSPIGPTPGK
jgi:hypothetical protein